MIIITPEMKDKVLADLLSADFLSFTYQYKDSQEDYGFHPQYVTLILNQFREMGLIQVTYFTGYGARINVQAKAMDLYRHGGFIAEEEILKGNIEKLGLELDTLSKQLTPNHIEQASHLSQIAAAIMQGLTLFQ